MALVGSVAAWLALVVAVAGAAVLSRPSWCRGASGQALATRTAAGVAALVSVATASLAWGLVSGDYRLVYVADASSRSASWPYRLAGLWGGMAGSLLFWTWLLSLVAVVATRSIRRLRPDLMAAVAAVLAGMVATFLGIGLAWANPFHRLAVPAIDGAGLAPILEHGAMLYHPPLLYLGLVSCAVPFAIAVAGLVHRSCDDQGWLQLARRWAAASWLFLTVGMLAGAHWAYVELGWGGFWAWDPVENAALLPWLGATALLHRAMVDEHRCLVRPFTVALALGTFVAALVGTLLTRSGAANSVHAFAEAVAVGRALAVLVIVAAIGSAVLWYRGRGGPDQAERSDRPDPNRGRLHRRSVLAANAVVFLGVAVVVAWGTLFPVAAEMVGGRPLLVNGRFFALLAAPLALAALGLAGVAPVLRWGGGVTPAGRRALPVAATTAVVAAIVAVIAGLRRPFAVAAVPLATFSAALLVGELVRRLAAPGPAVARRRAAGAIVAHLGVVVILAGIAGSTLGRTETVLLAPGQEVAVGAYRLRHDGAAVRPAADAGSPDPGTRAGSSHELGQQVIRLELALRRGNEVVTVLHPEQVVFEGRGLVLAETALRSTPLEDVLVAIRRVGDDGTAVLEVSIRPLVMWVWWGGILLAGGGALVLRSRTTAASRVVGDPRACAPAGAPPSPAVRSDGARASPGSIPVAGTGAPGGTGPAGPATTGDGDAGGRLPGAGSPSIPRGRGG